MSEFNVGKIDEGEVLDTETYSNKFNIAKPVKLVKGGDQ